MPSPQRHRIALLHHQRYNRVMSDIYSRRNQPLPDKYRYDFPDHVRSRVLQTMMHIVQKGGPKRWTDFLQEVQGMVVRECGFLVRNPAHPAASQGIHPLMVHAQCCSSELMLDFVELAFRAASIWDGQQIVGEINRILREEGIGFEFSPYGRRQTTRTMNGLELLLLQNTPAITVIKKIPTGDGQGVEVTYAETDPPRATKKTNEVAHVEIVMPCLQLLSGQRWSAANQHLLQSHEHHRNGNWRGAIIEAGCALETVLKTICRDKGWSYTPDKDVLSQLVGVCKENRLFFEFYTEILKNAGTIRNKLGGHGSEPQPTYLATHDHADHMIHLVSAHILFLARASGLA